MDTSVFNTLNQININGRTEKKGKLTYLSWAWAWAEVCKVYPDANYETDTYDNKPYLYDDVLGYMVSTKVTIGDKTIPMHLPVMDGANKSMKANPYTYSTKYGEKNVEAATMFDINKTIMRCLVKNLAMFGLGLYIYAGEDLPEVPEIPVEMLNQDQQTELKDYILENLFTVEQVTQFFNIKSLDDIPVNQLENTKQTIKGWIQ